MRNSSVTVNKHMSLEATVEHCQCLMSGHVVPRSWTSNRKKMLAVTTKMRQLLKRYSSKLILINFDDIWR